jgi:DNA-binding transcriptional LysR family regulator
LKAVATEENLTRAAELLYVSQPSLSKQNIREESDILLINRENNKISLTENGKVFLQYCERILALCEESCHIDLKNGERGNLTVEQVKRSELI